MAFFTSQQLFGNGAGTPGSPGWVPIDTSPPPTFSANNRGVAFGEQLTSAIANRPHYALALNDDDLNTRLALFETGGLDAAYDQGALAVDGGGRLITKDGGAVETVSALPSQYADDIANAHFRANQIGDTDRGGGGFESVAFGRAGDAALYGFMDRRGPNFSGVTVIADTVASSILGSTITVSAGSLKDGSNNTHLMLQHDLVEILSGPHAGLYVIATLSSTTACTVVALDGSTPAFAAGTPNVRFFRPQFGSFGRHGQTGTHVLAANVMTGLPGYESALDLVPGSTLGRYDTALSSPDGARYALRVRQRGATGVVSSVLDIDGQGQLRSVVSRSQLTAAQRELSVDFGAPAMVVSQSPGSGADIGYLAKSIGTDIDRWFGLATIEDTATPTTPGGTFAFNFINTAYNVDFTDVTTADWQISPGITLVEILTPSAQAGVYLVGARDPNNGNVLLTDLDGNTITSFPTSGAGTLRLFSGAFAGGVTYDVGGSRLSGWVTSGRASMMVVGPKEVGGAALLLESGNQNNDVADYFLIRGVAAEDGGTSETFSVGANGFVGGKGYTASDQGASAFKYAAAPTRRIQVQLGSGRPMTDAAGATPHWRFTTDPDSTYLWVTLENSGEIVFPINDLLRDGQTITDVRMLVNPGAARAGTNRMRLGLYYHLADWVTPTNNPVTPAVVGGAFVYDDASTTHQIVSLSSVLGAGHLVVKDSATVGRDYYIGIKGGNDGATNADAIYAIQVILSDPHLRNN